MYHNDPEKYYSKSIERFVRKYLLPRMLKEEKLFFITYSVGGKELAMMENAARHILIEEYGYPSQMVEKLFNTVAALCIGYAPDINHLTELSFKKIILLSASDQGLLISKSLYDKIYTHQICNRPFSVFNLSKNEVLLFLGHQSSIVLLDGKLNHDGHRFPHYLEAMDKVIPNSIFNYLHYLMYENELTGLELDLGYKYFMIHL